MTVEGLQHDAGTRTPHSAVESDALTRRLGRYVEVASPTGHELGLAEEIHQELAGLGIESELQSLGRDRANVVGRVKTGRPGPVLMLNGHLDTSYTGREAELTGRGYKNRAVIDGDWMYGNGVHNMKNALASYVEVLSALSAPGGTDGLCGEILFLGVAGEIEKAPQGRYQGDDYEGFGVGTSYALAHGLTADACILGEPTANTVGLSNMGVTWLRLRTSGTMAHTQAAHRAENAISKMRRVLERLDPWMDDFRARHEYQGVLPACDVTAIEGGWPYRVSRTPVFCDAFVCARIPPGVLPVSVYRDLQAFALDLAQDDPELDVEVDMYVSHEGKEVAATEPVVQALVGAHEQLVGEEPRFTPRGAYMDSSALIAHGIPTVVYGASGRVRGSDASVADWAPNEGEHTYLPDLVQSTEVVLRAVRTYCSDG